MRIIMCVDMGSHGSPKERKRKKLGTVLHRINYSAKVKEVGCHSLFWPYLDLGQRRTYTSIRNSSKSNWSASNRRISPM